MELQQEAARFGLLAPLRDHRALMCNADDYGRMCAVPKQEGANFRDMPGVITHADRESCVRVGVCWAEAKVWCSGAMTLPPRC
jgi:DNA (cytosine-5)-methyltransferase 1